MLPHPKLTHSPFGPCSILHNLPPAPLRWWSPIEHQFTQSFGQCSNCIFSLCGLHREGIDHQLMRDVGWGGGWRRKKLVVLKKRLLYMSSNPPPPLLNGLVAIIPPSRLHYSPRSIDLKSDLSISIRTHMQGFMWMAKAMQRCCEKVVEPLKWAAI